MAISKIFYLDWKILGVFPFIVAENGVVRISYGGIVYSMTLAVGFSVCYIKVISGHMNFILPQKTPMGVIANLTGLSTEFASLMWAWLYFGLRFRRLQKILVSFKNINEAFAVHGIRTDESKYSTSVKIYVVISIIIWVILCAVAYYMLYHSEPSKLAVWTPINVLRFVEHSIVLMFVNAMKMIKERFRSLNEKIRYLPNEGATRIETRRINLRNDPFETFATPDVLQIYGQIYSDLVDFTTFVVEFFSFSILISILSECIQMASGLYALCFVTSALQIIEWSLWVSFHLSEMIILVCVCDSTNKEANRTGNVLHAILVTGHLDKYVSSAKVLSLRLLQNPMKIELFGLFRIDFGIAQRVISALGVYLTIMKQLDNQNVQDT